MVVLRPSRDPAPSPDAVRGPGARATESPAGHEARATSTSVRHSLRVTTALGKPVLGAGARPPPWPKPRVTAPHHAPHPPGPACPPAASTHSPGRPCGETRTISAGRREGDPGPRDPAEKAARGACSRMLACTRSAPRALMSRRRTVARQLTTCKAHAGGLGPPDSGRGAGSIPQECWLCHPKPLAPGQLGCTYLGQLSSCYS